MEQPQTEQLIDSVWQQVGVYEGSMRELVAKVVRLTLKEVAEKVDVNTPDSVAAPTRSHSPITSVEAARRVHLSAQKVRVMKLLKAAAGKPISDFDLHSAAHRIGWNDTKNGLGTRRNELQRLGLVSYSDNRGITPTGGRCQRFVLSPLGEAWFDAHLDSATRRIA